MRHPLKRFLSTLAAAACLGLVGLNVVAYNQAYRMLHFTESGRRTSKPERLAGLHRLRVLLLGINLPRPEGHLTPEQLGLPFTPLRIPTSDGITLGAWHISHESPQRLVVLFHGYSADKSSLLREATLFRELGCELLLIDFRGSWESSAAYTTIGIDEALDVAAAYRYARRQWPGLPVILFGQSMGAAAVLRAVARHHVEPDALIVESVFDSMLSTVRNRFVAMHLPSFPLAELLLFWGSVQTGHNAMAHRPVDYARAVSCPALFLHGTDDPRATLGEARRVYDAVPSPKTFVTFPLTGHRAAAASHPEQWQKMVGAFLADLPG